MNQLSLSSLLLLSSLVYGLNDWSKPCLQGECSYDLPSGDGTASGTLKIWGSSNAISDITPAAGWTILGCDSNALTQDIRLVCQTDDNDSGCSHLLDNSAVGKIVRLPENCGASAFARVARSWIHEDQSIPSEVASRLVRRAGADPEVRGLALDTDFSQVDPNKSGNVSIAIQGATIPGANGNLTITPPTAPNRRSRLNRRGLFGFIEDAFNKFNSFDESITKSLPPVDVDKNFPLFDQSVSCGPFKASAKADVSTKAHAVITVGVAATGTIIPPKLEDFGLYAALDANLDGSLTLAGSASGSIDSGAQTLFQVGIPGLDFPGILSIGPTFKILGQAKANLDIGVDMVVDLSYQVNGAKLFFPASKENPSGGPFTPGDTPLKLSVNPSTASKGTVEAHLIPTVDFGVNALGGVAQATVSLNLDASAQMTLSLDASTQASATITPGKSARAVGTRPEATSDDGESFWPIGDEVRRSRRAQVATSTGASVNGCIDIGAALNVNAGADGSFFGIFNKSTKVNLFSKDFELFKKCLGTSTGTPKRGRSLGRSSRFSRRYGGIQYPGWEKRALSCPASDDSTNLISIVDTILTNLA